MAIYYFANHIYEFSNVMPLYRRIGGTFIVRKQKKRVYQFKYFLRNGRQFSENRTFMNAPSVRSMDISDLHSLEGILISTSNSQVYCDSHKCKTIFIGHGTGDKKYGGKATTLETYDYLFITGEKHLEKIKDVDVNIPENRLVKVGNLRFDQYVNREIDQEEYIRYLGIIDRSRKNILYAPTWKYGKGTLLKYIYSFCNELTKEFNLIVRPHFRERKYIPKLKLWAKLHKIKHVYFSNPGNIIKQDTMSDFSISDLLISDTSSILYEYLITQKPMIIVRSDYDNLHRMPESMDVHCTAEIYNDSLDTNILDLVKKTLKNQWNRENYKKLLDRCFYFNDGKSTNRAVEFISDL